MNLRMVGWVTTIYLSVMSLFGLWFVGAKVHLRGHFLPSDAAMLLVVAVIAWSARTTYRALVVDKRTFADRFKQRR